MAINASRRARRQCGSRKDHTQTKKVWARDEPTPSSAALTLLLRPPRCPARAAFGGRRPICRPAYPFAPRVAGLTVDVWTRVATASKFAFATLAASVASFCTALALQQSELDCHELGIAPDPTEDRIVGNRLTDNGFGDFGDILNAFKADLTWDGMGSGNCWSDNHFKTSSPSQLRVS